MAAAASTEGPGWIRVFQFGVAIAYPFAVHGVLRSTRSSLILWLLGAALFVSLFGHLLRPRRSAIGMLSSAAACIAFAAALLGEAGLLVYAPVAANLVFAATFGASLLGEISVAESFARASEPLLGPEQRRYCRRVTAVWALLFLTNAVVITSLAQLAELGWWTLYTGVLAHVLTALLALAELAIRVRRYGWPSAPGVRRWIEWRNRASDVV